MSVPLGVVGYDGVQALASHAIDVPFDGSGITFSSVTIPGAEPSSDMRNHHADWNLFSPDYFTTMRVPLRRGRDFTEADIRDAVINETMTERYWPNQDPIGRQL